MSNSNGMYSVLNIFKKLVPTQEQTVKAEAQRIYESVEAKGSILEGVKSTEKKLQEKYQDFKEGEKVQTKGGMIHKGTYGNAEFDDDGKEVKKHVPKTGQRGRPKKEKPAEISATKGDIFGRTTGKVPKGKKGTEVKGKAMSHAANNAKDEVDEGTDEKVYRHKGTYGTEYDGNDEKKVKHVPKAGQRGRPKKEQPAKYDWSQFGATGKNVKLPAHKGNVTKHKLDDVAEDIETVYEKAPPGAKAERMVKQIKAGYAKDGKLTDKEKSIAYATAWKAHNKGRVEESRQLSEGVNFTEMLKKHTATLDEMMQNLADDVMEFKRSGKVSENLRDCMSVYEYSKQQLTDDTHTQHALDLNPDLQKQAQAQPKPGVLGKVGQIAKKGLDVLTGPGDEELMRDLAKKSLGEEEELNELARLAGLSVSEGAKPDFLDVDKDGDKEEPMKKAVKDKEKVDESLGAMAEEMEEQQGRINVSTNMSSDGNKNINISADGDAADQLMAMLKMAGLASGEVAQRMAVAEPEDCGCEEEVVDEADAEYANTPNEEYEGLDAIVNQGDDMNRQKKQFADKPKAGDNPMATVAEEFDPIGELGRNLMQEYQALKVSK